MNVVARNEPPSNEPRYWHLASRRLMSIKIVGHVYDRSVRSPARRIDRPCLGKSVPATAIRSFPCATPCLPAQCTRRSAQSASVTGTVAGATTRVATEPGARLATTPAPRVRDDRPAPVLAHDSRVRLHRRARPELRRVPSASVAGQASPGSDGRGRLLFILLHRTLRDSSRSSRKSRRPSIGDDLLTSPDMDPVEMARTNAGTEQANVPRNHIDRPQAVRLLEVRGCIVRDGAAAQQRRSERGSAHFGRPDRPLEAPSEPAAAAMPRGTFTSASSRSPRTKNVPVETMASRWLPPVSSVTRP